MGEVCLCRCRCCTTFWVRTKCGAVNAVVHVEHGPCHVLLVKAMVTVDRHCFSKRVVPHQTWQKQCYRRLIGLSRVNGGSNLGTSSYTYSVFPQSLPLPFDPRRNKSKNNKPYNPQTDQPA